VTSAKRIGFGFLAGEIRLADLHRNYRQRLAERRAQRLAAEREAQEQAAREALEALTWAEHEAENRELNSMFTRIGVDRVIDCLVDYCGGLGGLLRTLDQRTASQRVAAE
jgi:hypothetical protein